MEKIIDLITLFFVAGIFLTGLYVEDIIIAVHGVEADNINTADQVREADFDKWYATEGRFQK